MGLPGAGKTTFAKALVERLSSALWLNADRLRELYNDWDFSLEGRLRQAKRMRTLADISEDDYVVADFVCPLDEMRDLYAPSFTIWMDTIPFGRFEDTNRMFECPSKADLHVIDWDQEKWVNAAIMQISANTAKA